MLLNMEIYFINICLEWLFKLYQEYLENIKNIFINTFNIQVVIKVIPEDSNYLDTFQKLYQKNNKYIFIGNIGHINNICNEYKSKNFYYLNIEQMSHESYFKLFLNLNKNIKVIDYSEENIPFHQKNYKKTFLMPPYFENINTFEKNIDIISFSNNEYRRNILNNIDTRFQIKYLDDIFGNERDEIFKKSKYYINIHCSSNHKTMELIRIINLLKKKVIVISQNSILKDLLFIKDNIITFENIENLNFLLNDILNNYQLYYNKIFENNNLLCYDNYFLTKLKLFIND